MNDDKSNTCIKITKIDNFTNRMFKRLKMLKICLCKFSVLCSILLLFLMLNFIYVYKSINFYDFNKFLMYKELKSLDTMK